MASASNAPDAKDGYSGGAALPAVSSTSFNSVSSMDSSLAEAQSHRQPRDAMTGETCPARCLSLFRFLPSGVVSFRLVSSRLVSSRLVSSRLVSYRLDSSWVRRADHQQRFTSHALHARSLLGPLRHLSTHLTVRFYALLAKAYSADERTKIKPFIASTQRARGGSEERRGFVLVRCVRLRLYSFHAGICLSR
ncbi:unnamed protein product [Closterium sp. NIES-53]